MNRRAPLELNRGARKDASTGRIFRDHLRTFATAIVLTVSTFLGDQGLCYARVPLDAIGIDYTGRFKISDSGIDISSEDREFRWQDSYRVLFNRFLGRNSHRRSDGVVQLANQFEVMAWDINVNTIKKLVDGELKCHADGHVEIWPNLSASVVPEDRYVLNGKLGDGLKRVSSSEQRSTYLNLYSCMRYVGKENEVRPGTHGRHLREEHGYLDLQPTKSAGGMIEFKSIRFHPKEVMDVVEIRSKATHREFGNVKYSPFAQAYLIHGSLGRNNTTEHFSDHPVLRLLHPDGRVVEHRTPGVIWTNAVGWYVQVSLTRRGFLWNLSGLRDESMSYLEEGGEIRRLGKEFGVVSPDGCRVVFAGNTGDPKVRRLKYQELCKGG